MQLTRLEIKGFKSFGDKTVIHFDAGITAIVGPNGCGKSNVVDAIRWVLGEQSTKALRSEKMENILFNGTKTRKAAQLAEVSLSFNNTKNIVSTAFSQITITRKLYRTGESEYRLNDVPCRLKDITDLFLDTGVGSDSYSIIELKMVEEIIANKEHSRRNLFEEASGISKYKVRKKQTVSRLKDTESDLTRVEDLLFEIEKNLKTLENQAKKAARYYKIKEEYKKTSISLAFQRLSGFKSALDNVEKQEDELVQKRHTASAEMATLESGLQRQKMEMLVMEQNLSLQQKTLNKQVSEIRNFESEKKIKNEQLKNLQAREAQLQKSLEQDRQQVNHVHYSKKRLQEEQFENQQKQTLLSSQLASQLEHVEEQRSQQTLAKQALDENSQQQGQLQQEIHTYEKNLAVLKIQVDSLSQQSLKTLGDKKTKEQELHLFTSSIASLEERRQYLQETIEAKQAEEQHLEHLFTETEQQIKQAEGELNGMVRVMDAKQNEYNLTKSLVDNLEGFPESIRFLKKSTPLLKEVPLFSDVLYCQEAYRVPIENFLEPYMNYYVVDRLQEAIQAIHLLNDAAKGRAGFFVLELVDRVSKEIEKRVGFRSAMEIVEVDPKYYDLCYCLLHQVYIGEDVRQVATDNEQIYLNKNGKFIRGAISVSGGSVGLFEGKRIGRAKNLENLLKEIRQLKKRQSVIEQDLSDKAALLSSLKKQSLKQEIEELHTQMHRADQEWVAIIARRDQYKAFIDQAEIQQEDIERKLSQLREEIVSIEPVLQQKQKQLSSYNEILHAKQQALAAISMELQQASDHYNQLNIQLHQQQNKVHSIEKDLEYRDIQLETLEKRIAQYTEEYSDVQKAIQDTLQHVDLSDDDLLGMYEEKKRLEQGLQEFEQKFYTHRGVIQKAEENLVTIRRRKEQTEQLITDLRDRKNSIKIDLSSLKERLSVEFSIDIDRLDEGEVEDEHPETLKQRSDKLKNQLEQFGAINPMAMEAFQEMEERFLFIRKEKQDLLDAKADLLKTMQEIDQNAEAKFMDAFIQVRENFQRVFRSLFNEEDTCDLIISHPDKVLESDIDIIARPKGKRPLSINQLSGGEKTLTAIALLFSLYLLKPAPFCIFDEVDAPLDDTNIDKFNHIIRQFSSDSQFIIVSHNKRTIASTDIIYGVTMVEPGISRVVAVDMREIQ